MDHQTSPVVTRLRDPAHRVSPLAPVVWGAEALVRSAVPVVVLVVLAVTGTVPLPWWAWILAALVVLAYVVGMPWFRYRVHRWEATDVACYTQTGWISRERRIAPLSRVQTVDLEQGPLARLVGLATVTVTTASAAGPLRIAGIERRTAEQLVEDLTRRTAATPDDAT